MHLGWNPGRIYIGSLSARRGNQTPSNLSEVKFCKVAKGRASAGLHLPSEVKAEAVDKRMARVLN
jgi:hypothetical protein